MFPYIQRDQFDNNLIYVINKKTSLPHQYIGHQNICTVLLCNCMKQLKQECNTWNAQLYVSKKYKFIIYLKRRSWNIANIIQ